MSLYADRVKETTTTTGTGNITLAGAVSQFVSFSSRFAVNDPFHYAIVGQTGTEWEVGLGHLSAGTTLVRDAVRASSNAGSAVNFSSGTKDVFCVLAAYDAPYSVGLQSAIRLNPQTISENLTTPDNTNGSSVGPITIADTFTVTIGANSNWVILGEA